MFGSGFKGAKVKTQLNLAKARIKLLRNKRENALKQMRRDIAMQLKNGQEASAQIRVEHIMREENILGAYDVVELLCELIVVRLPIIEMQKDCPQDLRQAVSSLIFAAPRCADLSELMLVKQAFQAKYGRDFVVAAEELRQGCNVHRTIIEKLSVRAPSGEAKLKLLVEIAKEHNLDWDPTASEEALVFKPTEDLLELPQDIGFDGRPHGGPGPSGGGSSYPGGNGGLVMDEGPSDLDYAKPKPSAPSKIQFLDPDSYDDRWNGSSKRGLDGSPGSSSRSNPLDYPTGIARVPFASGGGGQFSGTDGDEEDGEAYPSPAPVPYAPSAKSAPPQPEDNYTMVQRQKREDERKQKLASINEAALQAKFAAQRAAEAAKSASRLSLADSSRDETGDMGGRSSPQTDDDYLKPVKPSKMSPSVDEAFHPPAPQGKGGGFLGGGKGGAGGGGTGGGIMAVGQYGNQGGERGSGDPPFAPSVPPNFATGSTFDNYVETDGNAEGKDELELPDVPGARATSIPERSISDAKSTSSQGSGEMPGIDLLSLRFKRLQEKSGQSGGF